MEYSFEDDIAANETLNNAPSNPTDPQTSTPNNAPSNPTDPQTSTPNNAPSNPTEAPRYLGAPLRPNYVQPNAGYDVGCSSSQALLRPNYVQPYAGYDVGCSSSQAENIQGYPGVCPTRMPSTSMPFWNGYEYVYPSNDNNGMPNHAPPNPTDPQTSARINLGVPLRPNYVYARYEVGCSRSQAENIQGFPGSDLWQGQMRMPSCPTQAENIRGFPRSGPWNIQGFPRSQGENIPGFPRSLPWQGHTRMPSYPEPWNGYEYINPSHNNIAFNMTPNNVPSNPTKPPTSVLINPNYVHSYAPTSALINPNYVHSYAPYNADYSSQARNIQYSAGPWQGLTRHPSGPVPFWNSYDEYIYPSQHNIGANAAPLHPNYVYRYAYGCSSSQAVNMQLQGQAGMPTCPAPFWNGYQCISPSISNIANGPRNNQPPTSAEPQTSAGINLGSPIRPNYVHPYAGYEVEQISTGINLGAPLRPNYAHPYAGYAVGCSSSQAGNIQPILDNVGYRGISTPASVGCSTSQAGNIQPILDSVGYTGMSTPASVGCSSSQAGNFQPILDGVGYTGISIPASVGCSSSQAVNFQPILDSVGYTGISIPASACDTSTSTAKVNDMDWSEDDTLTIEPEPESPKNLREWIELKGQSAEKPDRILLFTLAARLVELVHRQGKGMFDMRPSSFIFMTEEHWDLKYVGRVLRDESFRRAGADARKRRSERGISGDEDDILGGKTQKVGEGKSVIMNASDEKRLPTHDVAELEKGWYGFPVGYVNGDVPYFNVYCLGLLLCELLCPFESIGEHHAAMVDLRQRILPPQFVSGHPEEARLCYRLLHPEPFSRPTNREIMQLAWVREQHDDGDEVEPSDAAVLGDDGDEIEPLDAAVAADDGNGDEVAPPEAAVVEDDGNGDEVEPPEAAVVEGDGDEEEDDLIAETDLLLHFLSSSEEAKRAKALSLSETIRLLDSDIELTERTRASRNLTNIPESSASSTNAFRDKLLDNIGDLETAYFSHRSHSQLFAENPQIGRSDNAILRERPSWYSGAQPQAENRAGASFDGISKFARHSKLELCGGLRYDEIMDSKNSINSISLDRDEELMAIAGASKKIKIFEFGMLLGDDMDLHYPSIEFSNERNFSCVCWNTYIKNYLASADYGGVVQIWDAGTGQGLSQYKEHQKRAWCVDFSKVDPTKFASGSDDCSIRIWSTNEKASVGLIRNKGSVCCVQFSPYSSHLLTYGSSDSKIYCYDLRHTKSPWCTIVGHEKTVCKVMFLDSETIVSASTDNTLKLWDLNKTTLNGSSTDACALTFKGHTNEKNFVGLTVCDGYMACGSETNEVYVYHRSMPMPILSHKFESIDDRTDHFVSTVCWRKKSEMLVAAITNGNIPILRMV